MDQIEEVWNIFLSIALINKKYRIENLRNEPRSIHRLRVSNKQSRRKIKVRIRVLNKSI